MTFYEKEIRRISSKIYANQGQIDTVIETRNYIDNNYASDLNLDLLSELNFVSKFHLLRLFKKYYGQTPKQYLTDKRVEKSKEFLAEGMAITETCFAVGFNSLGSFSSWFKQKTGLSPLDFQKRASLKKQLKS